MGASHGISSGTGPPPAADGGARRRGADREQAGTDAVVRPLARAAGRPCSRPGCPAPAQATLTFRYDSREASLGALSTEPTPAAYDLCATHADRTGPPRGWELVDARPDDEADADGEDTVAVLAAALRGDRGDGGGSRRGADLDHAPGQDTNGRPAGPRPVLAQRSAATAQSEPSAAGPSGGHQPSFPPTGTDPDPDAADPPRADRRRPGEGPDEATADADAAPPGPADGDEDDGTGPDAARSW